MEEENVPAISQTYRYTCKTRKLKQNKKDELQGKKAKSETQ